MHRRISRKDVLAEIGTNNESEIKPLENHNPVAFMMEKCYNMEENLIMDMEYEAVREFDANGRNMVVVKIGENAHVMDKSELRWVFSRWHPERWKKGA